MSTTNVIITFFVYLLSVSATSPDEAPQPRAGCTVTSYSEVSGAVSSCTDIIIRGITVPAGKALELTGLKDRTTIHFEGHIKFEMYAWNGPLINIKGNAITVQGASGHVLDGQGALYWDGKGGSGSTKPVFFKVATSGGSLLKDINLLNCPERCTSIGANDVTLDGWNIDCSAGDTQGGHNTDGFDISHSTNVVIKNSVVKNQDDCIAVNLGSNMYFSNLLCSGSHGLSLSVGLSKTSYDDNVVKNITFADSRVENSANAIHIKTHADGAKGSVADITYKDITFSGITNYGINIQEDYANGGSTGKANGNVPITNLKMINVQGSVTGKNSMDVYILCGSNGCSNWQWSNIKITGGQKSNSCNYAPSGYSC